MRHPPRLQALAIGIVLSLAAVHCGGNNCDRRPEIVIQSGDAPSLPDGGRDCSACLQSGFEVQVLGCNPLMVDGQPAVACLDSFACFGPVFE
jgi:hypothetical protein